ncbi:hypothetical protein [Bradyrhizobium sp. LTSP857]|uniref:hypothetical protein n=1 Tax=Bradyrhizobium sp. LTSP857 TaxID=1619231 RepID=UPI0005D20EB4|nr:hypothetical protein [Bradyrhizobium sp. LTSP857]KJC37719.1 hypothetical protein UP06_30395 [Bradyrhizobium sp. LTSP857]
MTNATPAKRALAALDREPAESRVPRHRITKKVAAAIDLLVKGECKQVKEAAEQAGLTRETLSRALAKPHVADFMRQEVVRNLNRATMRAGATKVELLDSNSELVRDRASSFVLALAGIAPAEQPSISLNVEIRAGYVIDLSDDPAPAPRIIDHV